eukprot:12258110-Heterocapsa_arctica.AAC.1
MAGRPPESLLPQGGGRPVMAGRPSGASYCKIPAVQSLPPRRPARSYLAVLYICHHSYRPVHTYVPRGS